MRVTASVDTSGIDALIKASLAVDSPEQIEREAMASDGEVKRLYEEDFTLEQSPEGEGWAPQKYDYGHPLLRDTFALWSDAEVTPTREGQVIRVGIEYAEYLHNGTPSISPRRLVPVVTLGRRWADGIGRARLLAPPVLP